MSGNGSAQGDLAQIIERWKKHQASFKVEQFETSNSFGVLARDFTINPPSFQLLFFDSAKNSLDIRAGDLLDLYEQRLGTDKIVEKILDGSIKSKKIEHSLGLKKVGLLGDGKELAIRSVKLFAEGIADARTVARLPIERFVGAELARFEKNGIGQLRSALNEDALKVLSTCGDFTWRDYLFYAEQGDLGVTRRQAAEQYPLLASQIVKFPSVRRAVDKKESLSDALQKTMGEDENGKPKFSNALIKRLRSLDWPTNGMPIDKLLAALASFRPVVNTKEDISPDWFPKNKQEWDAFCDIAGTIGVRLVDSSRQSPGVLYGSSGGKWIEFRDRLAKSYTDTRPPEGSQDEDKEYFKNAIDWKSLAKLPKDKVEAAAQKIATELADLPERINREAVADWIVRLYAPEVSKERIESACIQAEDMANAFVNKVLIPIAALKSGLDKVYLGAVHFSKAREVAAQILFEGKAANNIFELSRHFHSQAPIVMAAGSDDEIEDDNEVRKRQERLRLTLHNLGVDYADQPDDSWAPLTMPIQAPNGIWIMPLINAHLLKMEGNHGVNPEDGTQGLSHCVAGYAASCRQGHHILSMRQLIESPNGNTYQRLSTAEISPVAKGNLQLNVRQHYGHGNRTPPEAATRAFEWYKQQIADAQLQINYDGIRQYLGAISEHKDEVQTLCDYKWWEPARIEKALAPWRTERFPYLGKKYRSMSLEELAQDPAVQELTDLINPIYKPLKPR